MKNRFGKKERETKKKNINLGKCVWLCTLHGDLANKKNTKRETWAESRWCDI